MQQINWKFILYAVLIMGFGYMIIHETMPARPSAAPAQIVPRAPTPEELAAAEKARREAEDQRHQAFLAQDRTKAMSALETCRTLLEGAETDLKRGNISSDMEVYAIGAMLEVMQTCASDLQRAWNSQAELPKIDLGSLKILESRLSSFQQRALPKMRLAFGKRTKETLWVHDVTVRYA